MSNIIRSATSVSAVREIVIKPYTQKEENHNEPSVEETPVEYPEELLASVHEKQMDYSSSRSTCAEGRTRVSITNTIDGKRMGKSKAGS
ncbi:hypothetical protein [Bacillus sp. JCM 19041]|uniref:hypothetical protein n=1 Tax=Bacillus sp. JCM 19041 TaxID=1460637 RepID=UPI0006D08763